MKVTLHRSQQTWHILVALILVTLVAVGLSQCPTLGLEKNSYASTSVTGLESLSYYGEWIDSPRFGRIWQPYTVHGWRPLLYGHWIWTQRGWMWVSYEPFGWIVYHHGYWTHDPFLGWIWIPGYVWSPTIVVWIHIGDFIGWAPLPPPGVEVPDPWTGGPIYWNFVDANRFTEDQVYHFVLPQHRIPLRTNTVIRKSPDVHVIERNTGKRINPVQIQAYPIVTGKHRIQKTELPPMEKQKIQKHEPDVERRVLKPKVTKPAEKPW